MIETVFPNLGLSTIHRNYFQVKILCHSLEIKVSANRARRHLPQMPTMFVKIAMCEKNQLLYPKYPCRIRIS